MEIVNSLMWVFVLCSLLSLGRCSVMWVAVLCLLLSLSRCSLIWAAVLCSLLSLRQCSQCVWRQKQWPASCRIAMHPLMTASLLHPLMIASYCTHSWLHRYCTHSLLHHYCIHLIITVFTIIADPLFIVLFLLPSAHSTTGTVWKTFFVVTLANSCWCNWTCGTIA